MVDYNRLTIENQNLIVEKAKTKADGIYTFRGIVYRVKDNRATHFACNGEVIEPFGYFNTVIGLYDKHTWNEKFARKALQQIK